MQRSSSEPSGRPASRDECKDTGLAVVLILLLCVWFGDLRGALPAAVLVLLALMTVPGLFSPLARLWFGLSRGLGSLSSRVVLTLLFVVMVVPVGLFRRALGKDPLRLKAWKQGRGSVFRVSEHTYRAEDLTHPY